MDWAQRITHICDSKGISLSELCELTGFDYKYVHALKTGKSKNPRTEFIQALVTKVGISSDWLITGEGQMSNSWTFDKTDGSPSGGTQIPHSVEFGKSGALIPRHDPPEIRDVGETAGRLYKYPDDVTVYRYKKGSLEPVEIKEPDICGMVFIPVYSQSAAAGPGQPPTQLTETEGKMPLVYDLFGSHNPRFCGICRVVGDSMTDITLSNGDWVIFDRSDVSGDGIFVISMFGEVRVKRLQYRIADQTIVISSENRLRYPEPEVVKADAIAKGNLVIYGRVFSWMHKHPY